MGGLLSPPLASTYRWSRKPDVFLLCRFTRTPFLQLFFVFPLIWEIWWSSLAFFLLSLSFSLAVFGIIFLRPNQQPWQALCRCKLLTLFQAQSYIIHLSESRRKRALACCQERCEGKARLVVRAVPRALNNTDITEQGRKNVKTNVFTSGIIHVYCEARNGALSALLVLFIRQLPPLLMALLLI